MIRHDHKRPVADEQVAIDLYSSFPKPTDFLQEGHGVEHDAIADDAEAVRAQDTARHQLQNELLAVNDDGVSGVVAAGIAGHHGKILREHVHNLAFAFVAPLSADDDRSLAFFQMPAPTN